MSGVERIEDRLAGDIQVMKNLIGDVRNPLAHGLGGGVTGPEEDLLWEPCLLVDADEDIVSAFYQSLNAARQQKYHQKLRAVTVRSVAVSEALFRELNQYISKSVPKDTDSQPSGSN